AWVGATIATQANTKGFPPNRPPANGWNMKAIKFFVLAAAIFVCGATVQAQQYGPPPGMVPGGGMPPGMYPGGGMPQGYPGAMPPAFQPVNYESGGGEPGAYGPSNGGCMNGNCGDGGCMNGYCGGGDYCGDCGDGGLLNGRLRYWLNAT